MLSASVSRAAGGIFEVERRVSQELARQEGVRVGVFGVEDEFTSRDLDQWSPLRPEVFAPAGPASFGFCPGLWPALARWRPDLVHLHSLWMYPSVVTRRWRRASGKPTMITANGMLDAWALRNSRWKKRVALALFERGNLAAAGCIQALNAAEAASVRDLGLTNPIAVIPNAVDLPDEDAAPGGRPAWAAGRRVLLFLGRIHPKKGLVHLVRAARQWREASVGEPWVLAIAGWDQGGHEGELKALADELRLPWLDTRDRGARSGGAHPAMVFVGPQFGAGKEEMYRLADAFVLPSFSEGLPMAVLEAWAYRKPVLMTAMCNLPEGFAAGAALPVEPSAESIAAGLRDLDLLPEDRLRAMGGQGRRLVEEQFSWPQVAAQMREVYEWLLGGGARPACMLP